MTTIHPAGGFWMWFVQASVTLFFATGFVSYYTARWHELRTVTGTSGLLQRWGQAGAAIGLGLILHIVGDGGLLPVTGLMFHNMGLFILAFIVLDEGITRLEYLARAAALVVTVAYHHQGAYDRPQFAIAMVLLGLWLIGIARYGDAVRYHTSRHIAAFSLIGLIYWPLLPLGRGSVTLVFDAVVLYALTVVATGIALRRNREIAAIAAENARRVNYDALTNAKSFANFQREVTAQFDTARAQGQPLAMMAIDIDHFKQINDHYGHLAGNDILVGIAGTLRAVLRKYPGQHALYRVGGEEFNVIFNTTAAGAQPIAEACWATVRDRHYQAGAFDIAVTLSVGLAELQPDDPTVDALFQHADDNLYQSKHRGRDTVTVNGVTRRRAGVPHALETYTLYTQQIFDTANDLRPLYNEVLLGQYAYEYERWDLPEVSTIPLAAQLPFMHRLAQLMPTQRLAINLGLAEFCDPRTPARLAAFLAADPHPAGLVVMLTTQPELATLAAVAPAYHAVGIHIVLEVLGTERLDQDQLFALMPHLNGLKFRLDAFRKHYAPAEATATIQRWYAAGAQYGCSMVINYIENSQDAAYVRDVLKGRYVQGFYYDRPQLPRFS